MSDLRTRYHEYVDYPDDEVDYPDDDAPLVDARWRPVAMIAGGVFLAAVVATGVILNSNSSGAKATVVGPPPTRTVVATPAPTTSTAPRAAPSTSLPPETVTTLTPAAPPEQRTATAAPQAAPPPPAVNPRTVVYTVNGTKQLLDLVSVVYTDAQGMPHTDVNVTLPWTKTVVLNPGVGIESVTATSLYAKLNCTIVDAAGQTVAASTNNSMIATCTR